MITIENIKKILDSLGFVADIHKCYTRQYGNYIISVDFENNKFIYPKELTIHDQTTSNFVHNENFVVFECVCRLLDKGYRAEHIELEPRWVVGHDLSGGKADILVRKNMDEPYIIIECKTAGVEYNKEKRNTEENGGQVFSYLQQVTSTKWLALYASDWDGEKITYRSDVIHSEDDANILKLSEKDNSILTYKKAHNSEERFATWAETYCKEWLNNTIFDVESRAYEVGVAPLRKGKLEDFADAQGIINKFEEILRHNNVSDKENAFNRLTALFICKLVDEITKGDEDEVEFQYKQGIDTYETLQDRLQRLHKRGMEEFMQEELFYVESDYADNLFQQYTGQRRKRAIEELNETIRKLKFYTNNDFAFKDVHNEDLFYQNGKILVEVVQLFQPYRIVFSSKNQVLGDLFENLLNKGFKQNEGQFFTPIPITRFIWDALPLKNYIRKYGLPRIIDYSCGAAHFLTDGIEAIHAVAKDEGISNISDNKWVKEYIFGIEKDYRLARVSKVSMFMNGAGDANIIFGDGLENCPDKGIKAGSFDILVANPPYSVQGFKRHLVLKNNSFELLNVISDNSDEIEVLFIERIAQLLKPHGIAAVILPASVLNNDSNSYYTRAREELLKNFLIRAIVCFGNSTFGATSTNTVTLFLERYNEPPRVANLVKDSVDAIMNGEVNDDLSDSAVLSAYVRHQGITRDEYMRFICKGMSYEEIVANSYLKEYADVYSTIKVKAPRNATKEEEKSLRDAKFYESVLSTERDKLYFFTLVYEQRTLVITAPVNNKEQQEFLGYAWSTRGGQEGMKIIHAGGKLYDDKNRFKSGTLSSAIRSRFAGIEEDLQEDLQKYAKTYWLKDMMEFSRMKFIKEIATVGKNSTSITSKYHTVPLGGDKGVCNIKIGGTPSRNNLEFYNGGTNLWVSIAEMNGQVITDTKKKITDEAVKKSNVKLIPAGTTLLSFKLSIGKTAIAGKDLYTNEAIAALIPKDKKIKDKYLFCLFNSGNIDLQSVGNKAFGKSLNSDYLNNKLQIPLPPMDIQEKIVSECESIDEEYNQSLMNIEESRRNINGLFSSLEDVGESRKLKDICHYATKKIPFSTILIEDYVSTDNLLQNCEGITLYEKVPNIVSVVEYIKNDILLSNIRPYLKKLWIADKSGGCNADVLVIRINNENYLPLFIYNLLSQQKFFDYVMLNVKGMKMPRGNKNHIMQYTVPNLSLDEQRKIVAQIEIYNKQIVKEKTTMDACIARKQAVVNRYLF